MSGGRRRRSSRVLPADLCAGLGVALGTCATGGVILAGSWVRRSHAAAWRALGDPDLVVRTGAVAGLDEEVLDELGADAEVRLAAPLVEGRALAQGPGGRLEVMVAGVTVAMAGLGGAGAVLAGVARPGGRVLATRHVLARSGARPGAELTLLRGGVEERLPVDDVVPRGIARDLNGGAFVAAPLEVTQELFGVEGRLSAVVIELRDRSPANVEAQAARLRRVLGDHRPVTSLRREARHVTASLGQVMQTKILLALVASVAGSQLVLSAASLRPRGQPPARLRERALVASVATILGDAGACALAGRFVSQTPAYVRDVYGFAPSLKPKPRDALALLPPSIALSALHPKRNRRFMLPLSALVSAAGLLLSSPPPRAFAARGALGTVAALGAAQLVGATRTGASDASASGATAAVAIAGAVCSDSLHSAGRRALGRFAQSFSNYDLMVSASEDNYGLVLIEPAVAQAIASHPDVAHVYRNRYAFVEWRDATLFLAGVDPGGFLRFGFDFVPPGRDAAPGPGEIVVSTGLARAHRLRIGDSMSVSAPAGTVGFRVAGVFVDPTWPGGVAVISEAAFVDLFRQPQVNQPFVQLRPGADAGRVRREIARSLDGIDVRSSTVMHAVVFDAAAPTLGLLRRIRDLWIASATWAFVDLAVRRRAEREGPVAVCEIAAAATIAGELLALAVHAVARGQVDATAGLPLNWKLRPRAAGVGLLAGGLAAGSGAAASRALRRLPL